MEGVVNFLSISKKFAGRGRGGSIADNKIQLWDHIKLRQPQQLSHTAIFHLATDPNIGPNLMHTAVCRESGSSVVGSELYDWDSLSVREGHAEGPHV